MRLSGILIASVIFAAPALGQSTASEGPADEKAKKTYEHALEEAKSTKGVIFALDDFKKADKQDGGRCRACHREMVKYGIKLHDRELACAPFRSPEGQAYFAAMKCAANMGFANRQVILHRIREVFSRLFRRSPEELGMRMVYDVAHNTAKLESHLIEGVPRQVLVHRKGATRSLGPGMPGLPACYRETGQPVIIGGSMETGSYLLAGLAGAAGTFCTTAHGSGRTMSRHQAKKLVQGRKLLGEMEQRGIHVRTASYGGLAEEAGLAYKDIDVVVRTTEEAGLSRRVVKLVPMGNIKG